MKAVMISIQPKWVEKIASGEKTIEVRKTAPKCGLPFKGYIYATEAKKWFRSGIILTSNELLWLSSGKIKMCDGFELWADGEDYQCVNRKVIGEFVCDKVDNFYCVSVPYQRENNLGYGQFIDNGVYKASSWHEGIAFERNDRYINTMLNNNDLKEMCLTAQELFNYIGVGKHLYGWHISNLKIYDKPKELSEFFTPMGKRPSYMVERPPQSWQYVEE